MIGSRPPHAELRARRGDNERRGVGRTSQGGAPAPHDAETGTHHGEREREKEKGEMKTESRCRSGEVCTAARPSPKARLARPWARTAGATDGPPPAPALFLDTGVLTFPSQQRLTRRRAHTVAPPTASLLGRCTRTVRGPTGIHRTASPHRSPSHRGARVANPPLLPPHRSEERVRSWKRRVCLTRPQTKSHHRRRGTAPRTRFVGSPEHGYVRVPCPRPRQPWVGKSGSIHAAGKPTPSRGHTPRLLDARQSGTIVGKTYHPY